MSYKILIALLLITVTAFSIYFYSKTTNPATSPLISPILPITPSISPQSSLYFSPDTINAALLSQNEVDIKIESQGKYPEIIQFEIAYDPEVLNNIILSPGPLFNDADILLNLIDEKNGRISYAISLKPGQKTQFYSGVAAKMYFSINKNSPRDQTEIHFLPKTAVLSQDSNIPIKIAYGLKIIIEQSLEASKSSIKR